MAQARVERIVAHAALADARAGFDEAASWAADGDDDWAAWIEDVEHGRALVLRMDVVVEVRLPDDTIDRIHVQNDSLWIEKHIDVPRVEEQVRQLSSKDFGIMSRELQALGVTVPETDLAEMYVHVTLDRSLREQLSTAAKRESHLRPPGVAHPPDGSPPSP